MITSNAYITCLNKLKSFISERFSESEIILLCDNLNESIEDISPSSDLKSIKAKKVVDFFERRGEISNLLNACLSARKTLQQEIQAIASCLESTPPKRNLDINVLNIEELYETRKNLERLLETSDYTNAANYIDLQTFDLLYDYQTRQNNEGALLEVCEIGNLQANALIYTGDTETAIELLANRILTTKKLSWLKELTQQKQGKKVTWSRIYGRTHRLLGYAYWINKSQLQKGLQESVTAISYFNQVVPILVTGELATVYDNIGRIYTELGDKFKADLYLEKGRELRIKDDYRYALSLNSRALFYLTFGNPENALILAEEAYIIFHEKRELKGERGCGLALLTKGMALRRIGERFKYVFPDKYSKSPNQKSNFFKNSIKCFNDAIHTLNEAEKIFSQQVDEEIKLIDIWNELGCTYRERWKLVAQDLHMSLNFLEKATTMSKKKYLLQYADSQEDLARIKFMYSSPENYDDVLSEIKTAEDAIPDEYFNEYITNRNSTKHIEKFLYLLGKLTLLRGHVAFQKYFSGLKHEEDLIEALICYCKSSKYFYDFFARDIKVKRDKRMEFSPYAYYESSYLYQKELFEWLDNLNITELKLVVNVHIRIALIKANIDDAVYKKGMLCEVLEHLTTSKQSDNILLDQESK